MNFLDLPEECIAVMISFTSPYDACRISTVSRLLRTAADSNTAWERFLPSDSRMYMDHSLSTFSNKQLFFRLCESPLLIDDGRKSFWMEKRRGKKCWMLSARKLEITWVDSPEFWIWISTPDSRFEEVAGLLAVCWFEIRGKIKAREDGWLEIELGEYYVGFDEEELEMSILETRDGGWKGGIIVQGIEIRPKQVL
ncbi:putative F-box protein PP2-B12 isoform X2 [Capsella rubella]|uniref:putative F-box protein PP2-B12 isoform X2 n=1 Tax=Capsella rubella TaxID=81985 RepID=UPI000CD4DA32|nr:putative F-box protein PP2-B12 isoform X2 [Capsella rubella]